MRVLVLGASGFVGSRITRALHAGGAHTVVAGLRRENAGFRSSGIEQRLVDATDRAALLKALEGIDAVVNCVMGSNEGMVRSTENLVSAMREAGARRLVHFSSIAVFGGREGLIGDDAPFATDIDAYGAAKVACETILKGSAAAGLETVILRPALIYGPGSDPWTGRIGRLLRWRRLGDLGAAGDGFCNLVYIDDVVAAAIRALEVGAAAGQAFNLAEPEPPRWNRYLMDFAREIGATPVHRLPGWQLTLERKAIAIPLKLAQIAKEKTRLRTLPVPDAITPSFARLFAQETRFAGENVDAVLGFARTPYPIGLARAANWFRGH